MSRLWCCFEVDLKKVRLISIVRYAYPGWVAAKNIALETGVQKGLGKTSFKSIE